MHKILLVDEKKDIRDFIARFFNERNLEVLCASNGIDALLSIKRDSPDLVLLELDLQDIDGLEVLKHIKKLKRNLKVIVVSCIKDLEIVDEAKRLGVISYLTKPIMLGELMDVVLKNLGRPRRFFRLERTAN